MEYPGVRRSGWWDFTFVKNLTRVGVEVCAKLGGGRLVHERGTGTNSLLYIY